VDNSPKQDFLIKFQVNGLAGHTVTRATLKLYNVSSSNIGGNFYRVNDQTWEEETVTWNNAPAHDGTLVASLGAVTTGNWYSLDVTSLISADGTYSLRVSSTSSDGADYRSKEGVNPPVLEVEMTGGATATTGPTATASETPTPTHTPTPTPTLPPTATATLPAGNMLTFAPQDDVSIHSGYPGNNYGANPTLYVDNSPVQHILLKFQVSGLAGRTVTRATLKLYNTDNSSIGGKFYRVNDQSWSEESVTWNTAPAHDGTLVASLGAVTGGNWYSVDLTSLISADGTYSLRVSSTSSDGADYSSKEGANLPVLEVEVAGGSTATPGATATATVTFTQTASPTPTYTPSATATATATPQIYQMTYSYDGDGNLVKSEIGDVVTYYIGAHYEKKVQGSQQNERKYYFAGSSRLAMRENGVLTWLLSDHLGSTSVTANASGNMLSSLRYSAFGELRAATGVTGTDYRYTGQRSEAEIGLYYYVARSYDPALGRFVSADTMIPDPYNPKDWDRYSYVRNNPVNLNDPTGHDVDCGIGERCRLSTINEFTRVLKQTYKINVSKSANFNLKELKTIYNALGSIEGGINTLTNGSGLSWITNNLNGSKITRTPATIVEKVVFQGNAHVGSSTVYLPEDFTNNGWGSLDGKAGSMIIHEFGHILDNRSKVGLVDASILGGGAGDQLMNFINAKPNAVIRCAWGINYGDSPVIGYDTRYPREGTASYGNNSTADYFANTFAAGASGYSDAPQLAAMWMAAYIDLTK